MKERDWQQTNVCIKKYQGRVCGPDIVDAVRDGVEVIYQRAQVYVPVAQGPLSRSMQRGVTHIDLPREVSGKVTMWGPNGQLPYAWMREAGGTIIPKPSNPTGRLWWRNENGQLISAVSVTQKGSHYMEKGRNETKVEVKGKLIGAMTHAFHEFD